MHNFGPIHKIKKHPLKLVIKTYFIFLAPNWKLEKPPDLKALKTTRDMVIRRSRALKGWPPERPSAWAARPS